MNQVTTSNKPRLILPGSVIAKCVDGRWSDRDGLPLPNELLATGTSRGLQCFKNGELLGEEVEQPGKPLPNPDVLNAQIPQEEWGIDQYSGNPQPPWRVTWAAYLVDPVSATRYTFLNSTWGAQLAVEGLEGRMEIVIGLRGPNIRAKVKLDSKPLPKTKRNITKQRPEFTVLDWVDLTGPSEILLQHGYGGRQLWQLAPATQAKQIEHKPASAPATPKKQKKIGKSVKPPTVSEEINDSLPEDLAPPVNPLKGG